MKYIFSTTFTKKHVIDIEAILKTENKNYIEIQLPAWRPGRYELQNFAKNIIDFKVKTPSGDDLPFKKITKDRWQVETKSNAYVHCFYSYFANEKNAGSSYLDDTFFYCNPVNCCVYLENQINESCEVEIYTKKNQKIACGISAEYKTNHFYFKAKDFHHLVDSPWFIGEKLQQKTYEVNALSFHIWVAGNYEFPWEKVLEDFKKFTVEQIKVFGEFPEKNYHFLLWMLPVPFYHGVEHRNSTMMVLGPDNQPFEEMYIDLLGLASHELFHAWNICKIRPNELLPYNYAKENYFRTCFIAEGITTFYGDWMLYRSGVFDEKQYNKELETYYRRHFETADKAHQSLLEASFDLWLDGYTVGVPNRKVSVYHKGAIVAQILNEKLKEKSDGKYSLDDVLRKMWEKFGNQKSGYKYEDYISICEEIYGESLQPYFEKCIEGTTSLCEDVNNVLEKQNLKIERNAENKVVLVERKVI